jgi:hypothetical protein
MTEVQPDTVWEMYSSDGDRWIRMIVAKVEDGKATLRYEGVLEFITVDVLEMQNNLELFRPASAQSIP